VLCEGNMKVNEIEQALGQMIPRGLAQSWDNVGLLVGDGDAEVKNVLLTIDTTASVLEEARRLKTDLIISYHPVIWDGLKKVTAQGPTGVVYNLIKSGISVYSIHTSFDVLEGGVNDGLAEILGIKNAEPLGDFVANPAGDTYKLAVFVPVESLAKVANAIFAAGAGNIGNYSHCGWSTEGTGTFLPLEGANPAIGKKGEIEKVRESRLEAVIPANRLDDVIAAMKKAHPYEMPAYDVYRMHDPQGLFGLGRIGKLAEPMRINKIIEQIKKHTEAKAVGLVGRKDRVVRTAAVCAGTCGEILNKVIAAKADLYLTGELKHHQAIAAQEAGLTCICLSHTVSERFILKKLAQQLKKSLDSVTIRISKKDADPFTWKNV